MTETEETGAIIMLKRTVFTPLIALFGSIVISPAIADTIEPATPNTIAQYWDTCGQMGWNNVDTFETDDFFVSICQENDVLHLVGEAKDLSGFVDLPVFETRDRRYAMQEGDEYLAIDNDLLITLQEIQAAED
jgi:hypothetical protein